MRKTETPSKTKPKMKAVTIKKEPYRPCKRAMALCDILKICRPDGSPEEKLFAESLKKAVDGQFDGYHNIHKEIKHSDGSSPRVLFSSHTDTVHMEGGSQQVLIDENNAQAFIGAKGTKGKQAFGSCLGADDGTGVWLMLEMIENKVPGYYIFHRAEECGGKGSAFIRDNWNQVFKENPSRFDLAIAFDRKGKNEVITHQRGGRCASDTSGNQFIAELKKQGLQYVLSDRGTFTDTANYSRIIPECYNLSVGYDKQHGPNETQDLRFAVKLADALINIDWTQIKAYRDPKHVEPKTYQRGGNIWDGYGGASGDFGYAGKHYEHKKTAKKVGTATNSKKKAPPAVMADTSVLCEFITQYPMACLMLLAEMGTTEDDIINYIQQTTQPRDLLDELEMGTRPSGNLP